MTKAKTATPRTRRPARRIEWLALVVIVVTVLLLNWIETFGQWWGLIFMMVAPTGLIWLTYGAILDCRQQLSLAPQPLVYSVPQRFGVGHILGVTAAFATLSALLRMIDAKPLVYAIVFTYVIAIGALQMVMVRVPRKASVVAGGWYLPLAVVTLTVAFGPSRLPSDLVILASVLILPGFLLGYLGGVLVAGYFLGLDRLDAATGSFLGLRQIVRASEGDDQQQPG